MNKESLELLDLYKSHYSILSEKLTLKNEELKTRGMNTEQATNPLLLTVNDEYLKADIKIMFFGQETNLWLKERKNGAFLGEIQPVINLYNNFYWNKGCYSYGGQFWNGIGRFKDKVNEKYPNKKLGLLWNNVVKIGKCKIGFPYQFNGISNKYFNVIAQEIEITKPDVAVFFSGPNYDNEIKKALGEYNLIEIDSFTKRQLCMIENKSLPKAFRTYHPNYLWRIDIDKYINAIVSRI